MRGPLVPGLVPGLLLVFALAVTLTAQQAQDLYQRALVQEHATGHLDDAIALYLQASQAAGRDRALAARALIRAAGAYEKLGQQTAAANVYTDVVRLYPEQRAEAAIAQQRLARLRRQAPVPRPAHDTPGPSTLSHTTAAMFERYCSQCHNARTRAGGLDLGSPDARSIAANTAQWERVVRRLHARRDPPLGTPRPDDGAYRAAILDLQQMLDVAYAANRPSHDPERVDDAELARRVAALLWSAPPDAALLADARRGVLHEPDVLHAQVARMLRDPRSASLVSSFFSKWLSLDRLKTARPDPSVYGEIDTELIQAMGNETRLLLESQLRDDRDAMELWTADYTYVNERLARYYGIPGVDGPEFRRVAWPDDRRAGILGQAAILTGLSMPGRTSPTIRGSFILSRFLGIDIPPPPANVPPLAERPGTPGTMRDRLLAHKLNPSCATCHSMFDPLGLALEHFDGVGRWRAMDGGLPIDASGTFTDGTRFDGAAGLRSSLRNYPDAYYTSVAERLLAHALERRDSAGHVYDYEMPAVRQVVRDAAARGYRWSAMLAAVAASTPFQEQRRVP